MAGLSEKIYLSLKMPTEDLPVSDHRRILLALEALGYDNVQVPLATLQALLLDRSRLQEVRELAENMFCVQFASIPDFLVRMQAAKFVPHTDMNRYPSIQRRLAQEKNPSATQKDFFMNTQPPRFSRNSLFRAS